MKIYSIVLHFYQSMASKLLFFIQLQLFMMILSLPILIAWGLPISLMSVVGNLLFSPFLSLFLLLSSIIFFFELCYLPNGFLLYCLDWCTRLWTWWIACGSSQWLVGFMKPPGWVLCTIFIGLFLILHHKKVRTHKIRIVCLLLYFGLVILFLKWYPQEKSIIHTISCNNGCVTVLKTASTLTLIDPGVMGRRVNANWVEYTLMKELIEKFGTLRIDILIITRPTLLTLDYAAHICRIMDVRSLYLVTWHGETEKRLLQKYGRLRYELSQKKGKFYRITKEPQLLKLDTAYKLVIEPLLDQLSYKDISFAKVAISLVEGESRRLLELQSC